MKLNETFKDNDTVFFYLDDDFLRVGRVDLKNKLNNSKGYIGIKSYLGDEYGISAFMGSVGVRYDCVFHDREDALKWLVEKNEKIKEAYRNEIPDVSSLVHFMFHHDLSSEFLDENAKAVVIEKAKELLNMDIQAEEEKYYNENDMETEHLLNY